MPYSVLFIVDPDDEAEKQAIYEAGGSLIELDGTYAEKINAGVRSTEAELLFLGADDLDFHVGWLEAARKLMVDGIGVVGVNDLIPRTRDHATHFLMARWYAEQPTIDDGEGPLHTGYSHWRIDDELIATAKKRRVYAYAEDSYVEHLHPFANKAPDDATYEKGRARMRIDNKLFARRQALWT